MRQLSERHMKKIAKIRKMMVHNLKVAEKRGTDTNNALELILEHLKEKNYTITQLHSKGSYDIYKISNETVSFDIRHCVPNKRLTLSRKISIKLEATEDDKETLANLRNEPYRYEDIQTDDNKVIFRIKGYDWTKLDKWEEEKGA